MNRGHRDLGSGDSSRARLAAAVAGGIVVVALLVFLLQPRDEGRRLPGSAAAGDEPAAASPPPSEVAAQPPVKGGTAPSPPPPAARPRQEPQAVEPTRAAAPSGGAEGHRAPANSPEAVATKSDRQALQERLDELARLVRRDELHTLYGVQLMDSLVVYDDALVRQFENLPAYRDLMKELIPYLKEARAAK